MATSQSPDVIENPLKMVGAEYHVAKELDDRHGVKSVCQRKDNFDLRVVAYDDYAILSQIQTVCAWFNCGWDVTSAKREDGDIVVEFTVED